MEMNSTRLMNNSTTRVRAIIPLISLNATLLDSAVLYPHKTRKFYLKSGNTDGRKTTATKSLWILAGDLVLRLELRIAVEYLFRNCNTIHKYDLEGQGHTRPLESDKVMIMN